MVTVDDLVISLTIKETSKLGRLQKQLDSIVGKKGEKAPTFGLDASVKADLSAIKRRIIFLMPTTIPGKNKPYAMAETARIASSILEKDIRDYAEKITPKNPDVLKRTMAEFGVKTRPELVDALEDKIKDWQLRLEEVMSKTWTNDQAQKFLVNIDDLISRAEVPEGWSKVLMTNIDNAIGERNKEVAEILRKVGLDIKAEQYVATIKAEKLAQIGSSEEGIWRDKSQDEFLRAFNITSKEGIDLFKREFALIPSRKEGTQILMENFATDLKMSITDLWNITEKQVNDNEKIRVLSALLLNSIGYIKGGQRPAGIPLGTQKHIFESLKKMMTSIDPGLGYTKEESIPILEGLAKEFEHKVGKTMSDMFEHYRVDFLIGIKEDIGIIKDLFGEKIATQLKDVGTLWIEQKKLLTESNRGQFRNYIQLVGVKRLIGLASLTLDSFTSMFPNVLTKNMNLALKSEEIGLIPRLTEAQKIGIREEAESIFVEEKLLAGIGKLIEDHEAGQVDIKPEFKDLYNALVEGFQGMKALFEAYKKKNVADPPTEEGMVD